MFSVISILAINEESLPTQEIAQLLH